MANLSLVDRRGWHGAAATFLYIFMYLMHHESAVGVWIQKQFLIRVSTGVRGYNPDLDYAGICGFDSAQLFCAYLLHRISLKDN